MFLIPSLPQYQTDQTGIPGIPPPQTDVEAIAHWVGHVISDMKLSAERSKRPIPEPDSPAWPAEIQSQIDRMCAQHTFGYRFEAVLWSGNIQNVMDQLVEIPSDDRSESVSWLLYEAAITADPDRLSALACAAANTLRGRTDPEKCEKYNEVAVELNQAHLQALKFEYWDMFGFLYRYPHDEDRNDFSPNPDVPDYLSNQEIQALDDAFGELIESGLLYKEGVTEFGLEVLDWISGVPGLD